MTKIEITRQYVQKYLDLAREHNVSFSKGQISRNLLDENPNIFKDYEDARYHVRRATGSCGERNRKYVKHFSFEEMFSLIGAQVKELNSEPFIVPEVYNNTLWIADLHSKFMNRKAFEIAVNKGISSNCNSVIINGDFLDFYGHSKFDKNPLIVEEFCDEREWAQDILELLQNVFGYVVFKQGNHDKRRELHVQRLAAKMPELVGLTKLEDYLFFEGTNVQIVEDNRVIRYGKLNGIHGHEYQGGGGIHTAHNRLHKTFENVISAHSHKAQTKISKTISGDLVGSWALGCLCDLAAAYSPLNDWSHGFALTQRDSSGLFEVDNKIIQGNRVFSA